MSPCLSRGWERWVFRSMILKIFATLERVYDDKPYNTKIYEACQALSWERGGGRWPARDDGDKTVLLLTPDDNHNQTSLRSASGRWGGGHLVVGAFYRWKLTRSDELELEREKWKAITQQVTQGRSLVLSVNSLSGFRSLMLLCCVSVQWARTWTHRRDPSR